MAETLTLSETTQTIAWNDFLEAYGKDAVHQAALNWPETESVVFDFQDIQTRNPDLADQLLAKPTATMRLLASCVQAMDMPTETRPMLAVRIKNLPKALRMGPRQLRAEHLGKLVSVHGVVTAASPSLLDIKEACFECKICTTRVRVIQDEETRQDPVLCEVCDAQRPWRLVVEESRHIDAQHLRLQEPPEQVKGGATPEILGVRINGDIVQQVSPGSRVVVTGVLNLKYKRANGKAQTEAEPVLHGLHVQPDETELIDLESTEEELQEFADLAAKPEIHAELARCLAPSVRGLVDVKQAILMSLVGGPEWNRPDGSKVRGRIHILLAGDPGTAKSKLIGRLGRYTTRCVHVLGVEASRAGLSVAAVKDPVDGRWMLEAGALVMAHKHVIAIDELGYLDPEEDQPSLLSAMEDGFVQSTKVVKATLPAEATVVAAMNPILGRFDRYSPFLEQLGISAPIKSRFDLKFCLLDKVDDAQDGELADAVLADDDSTIKDERAHYSVPLSGDQLRRYIYHAKRLQPKMTLEAQAYIKEYYGRVRNQDRENPAFTPRQLEALRRLAGASARLRLSPEIALSDAVRAVDLMTSSLRSCGVIDTSGRLDGDLLQFGESKAQHDRMRLVLQAIKDLQRQHPSGYNRGFAEESAILDTCLGLGVSMDDTRAMIATLRRNSTIYQRGGLGQYAILAT